MYEALNRTFVTPLDRSDIYQLASALEGIVDDVFATSLQFIVHAMEDLPPGSCELSALIGQACSAIESAVQDLRGMKNAAPIRKAKSASSSAMTTSAMLRVSCSALGISVGAPPATFSEGAEVFEFCRDPARRLTILP